MGVWSDQHCHSYTPIFYLWCWKSLLVTDFLLASKPSHVQVTCQPSSCENTCLLSARCLQNFSPSSLPQRRAFLEINILWNHLRNIPAIDKEPQLYWSQGELHKLDDKQTLAFTLQSTEGVKKIDKLIHRIPDAPCLGHLISMTYQRRMTKG